MTEKKSVTLAEGAEMLIERLLKEPSPEKRLRDTLSLFHEIEKKAVHEAAIIYKLGGHCALIRLFIEHYGLEWSGRPGIPSEDDT
jgi:hypothetical protein